jgi:phenylalanyl-tRNA synthetase beta chain
MKFSLSWLNYFLETEATVAEIAAKLNAIGLEVEEIDDPSARLAGFRVARVLTAARHPDADKLQVLTVDAGDEIPLQVVCGAPNARAGLIGVLGLPGAVVPAGGMELKKASVRGVESNGMMCSVSELDLGDDHDGIIELPGDAPVGTAFADYHGSDPVFDVAITPNRPDCMGVTALPVIWRRQGWERWCQSPPKPCPGATLALSKSAPMTRKAVQPSMAASSLASPMVPRPIGCRRG